MVYADVESVIGKFLMSIIRFSSERPLRCSDVDSKFEPPTPLLGRWLALMVDPLLTSVLWLTNLRVTVSLCCLLWATKVRDTFSCALFCLIPDSCPPPSCIFQLAMPLCNEQLLSCAEVIPILWQGKFRFSDTWLLLILRASDMLDFKTIDSLPR